MFIAYYSTDLYMELNIVNLISTLAYFSGPLFQKDEMGNR